jgi:uncharacterized RDD family membrane protein YckC
MTSIETAPVTTDKPADFIFRLFAHFIDAGVVGVVANTVNALIRNNYEVLTPETSFVLNLSLGLLPFILMIPYAGYCYSRFGTTLGKMILGLKVQNIGGGHLPFWRGGIRDVIGKSISLLILGFGFVMIFFRPDKRALHDLIFKSEVRKVNAIRPILVIAGIFTAIFNFQFSGWNSSRLVQPKKAEPTSVSSSASTPLPVETPAENKSK